MKDIIVHIAKKLYMLSTLFRKNISVDFASTVSPTACMGLQSTRENKIVIRKSALSGAISAERGCRLFNVNCSGKIKLGRFVSLNGPGTNITSHLSSINIGSFSSVASNVVIQEYYHRQDKISTYFINKNVFNGNIEEDIYTKGEINIEEDVWIGSNSVILSGVTIGRGSIIGAGSVVTKNIPRYSIAVGNPAKVLKKRFSDEIIEKLEKSKWWELSEKEMLENSEKFNISLLDFDGDITFEK